MATEPDSTPDGTDGDTTDHENGSASVPRRSVLRTVGALGAMVGLAESAQSATADPGPGDREINRKYEELGGRDGSLGPPAGPIKRNPNVIKQQKHDSPRTYGGSTGKRRRYENGHIYWSEATGAHVIYDGPIWEQWADLKWEQKRPNSLRYPTSDPQDARVREVHGGRDLPGRYQEFQGGTIFWGRETGTVVIRDVPTTPPTPVLFKHKLARQGRSQKQLVVDRDMYYLGQFNARNEITAAYVPAGWKITLGMEELDPLHFDGPEFFPLMWSDPVTYVKINDMPSVAERYYRRRPRGTAQRFWNPTYRGYPLDWCRKWGEQCGEEAAREWAKRRFMNFNEVLEVKKAGNVGLSKVVTSNHLCPESYCDSFRSITIR